MKFQKSKSEYGFTLIELLVVVLILSVIGSIAIVSVRGVFGNSYITACKADLQTVNNAMKAYYNDNPNSNPASSDLYTGTSVSGSLAQLGYISPLIVPSNNKYKIVLQLPTPTPTPPTYSINIQKSDSSFTADCSLI